MTTPDLKALREAAEAATPGPWPVARAQHGSDHWTVGNGPPFMAAVRREADAAYIAACDPSVVSALLAERDALLARLDAVEADARRWQEVRKRVMVRPQQWGDVISIALPCGNAKVTEVDMLMSDAAVDEGIAKLAALQDTQP